MIDILSQPWHWAISGAMIVWVMFLLIFFGKSFGVSSSFKAICSIGGAGRFADYFNYNWKSHDWLLLFVAGSIIGGFICQQFFPNPHPINLSAATVSDLSALGLSVGWTNALVPESLFNLDVLFSLKGFLLFIVGGFLIGFGTRYAGGCTSGHAISGLSNLQMPSLVAVIGFFIGGLLSTHVLLPFILSL